MQLQYIRARTLSIARSDALCVVQLYTTDAITTTITPPPSPLSRTSLFSSSTGSALTVPMISSSMVELMSEVSTMSVKGKAADLQSYARANAWNISVCKCVRWPVAMNAYLEFKSNAHVTLSVG